MKILVLSDNTAFAKALLEKLHQMGNEHSTTSSTWPNYAPSLLQEVDFVLLNIANGVELNAIVRLRQTMRLPIFLIAPIKDEKTIVQVYASGIDDHLVPPVSLALLAAKLRVWQRWVLRIASPYS